MSLMSSRPSFQLTPASATKVVAHWARRVFFCSGVAVRHVVVRPRGAWLESRYAQAVGRHAVRRAGLADDQRLRALLPGQRRVALMDLARALDPGARRERRVRATPWSSRCADPYEIPAAEINVKLPYILFHPSKS